MAVEYRTITLLVMGVCAAVLVGWDIVVYCFNSVPNRIDTISGITRTASVRVWTIPYAVGALCGHLFLPGYLLRSVTWWGMTILIGIGVALGVFSYFSYSRVNQTRWRTAIRAYGILNAGVILGHLFWPQ